MSAGWAGACQPVTETEIKQVRIDGTTVAFELVSIPSGSVEINGKRHTINELDVSATEVTWDLYDVYLFKLDQPDSDTKTDGVSRPSKPYVPPDRGYGHAGYPAMGMTRKAATEFCAWLSKKTGDLYRLPTQAEWIYLAEGGAENPTVASAESAWTDEIADFTTHPVGKKAPNAWGLQDTLGNVAEWVAPGPGERPQDNPVAMGGSFLETRDRSTTRSVLKQQPWWNASDPQVPKSVWWLADCDFVGFRIVREPKAQEHKDQFKAGDPGRDEEQD